MVRCLGVMVLALVGCATNFSVVATRAAMELECPRDSIVVDELSRSTFHASGCGRQAFYVCTAHESCARNSEVERATGVGPPRSSGSARLERALRAIEPRVLACTGGPIEIELRFAGDGSVGSVDWGAVEEGVRGCVAQQLVSLRIERPPRSAVGARFDSAAESITGQAPEPPAVVPVAQPAAPAAEPAAPSAEPALRAALDARRADILACVSEERVPVVVESRADGTVTVALQGSLAGTPREGCVRDVLSELRVPEDLAPARVVHLVR